MLFTEYTKYLLALARGIVPVKQTPDGLALAETRPAAEPLAASSFLVGLL